MSKQSVSRKVSSKVRSSRSEAASALRIARLEKLVARLELEKRQAESLLALSRTMTSAKLRLEALTQPRKAAAPRRRKRVAKVEKTARAAPRLATILRLVPMPVDEPRAALALVARKDG